MSAGLRPSTSPVHRVTPQPRSRSRGTRKRRRFSSDHSGWQSPKKCAVILTLTLSAAKRKGKDLLFLHSSYDFSKCNINALAASRVFIDTHRLTDALPQISASHLFRQIDPEH